ncbi:MAG: ChbG/HpnK family deacetylase, partial [Acidobacteria bacterium]|nr:ChbG/HpnK family deacetylase [Acidobacteriota bacterium]
MKALILNGDDLGLAEAINDGIFEAHERGCLTSASLSVAGPALESAVAGAARCPSLGVGLHLTLVQERPLCPPEEVPSLVDRQGRLHPGGMSFVRRWLSGRIRAGEVRREVRAQLARAAELG